MSTFTASGNANGVAYTSTSPAYKVTSSATATASSDLSQANAKEEADNTAQQVANSVAQNDANVISQTLNLSPAGVIGQYSFLSLSYAYKIPINGNGTFNGLIKEFTDDEVSTYSKAITITSTKTVYNSSTFEPIPNTVQLNTLNSVAYNYGGVYGDKEVNGEVYSYPTAKSIINNNRVTTLELPVTINNVLYVYKLKTITSIRFYLDEPITNSTQFNDLNNNIKGLKISSKSLVACHVIDVTANTFTDFTGITFSEVYNQDNGFLIINLDFSKAISSVINTNVYPIEIITT